MRRAEGTTIPFVPLSSSLTLAFVVATIFTACSDAGVATEPPPPPPRAPAVSLSIFPDSRTLYVGDVAPFSYEALDSANRVVATVVEWTSDNPAVATVERTAGRV